jgi:thiol:disulfide interchange protein
MRLAVWEFWMGLLLCGALMIGVRLILLAPANIVTIYDYSNCYVTSAAPPCERILYRAGWMNVGFNIWCGFLLISAAAWLLWDLWTAVAPRPITDDFLQLLDVSFGRNWRSLRTWPWARFGWAYGFTALGAAFAVVVALAASLVMSPPPAVPRVDTSQQFRAAP